MRFGSLNHWLSLKLVYVRSSASIRTLSMSSRRGSTSLQRNIKISRPPSLSYDATEHRKDSETIWSIVSLSIGSVTQQSVQSFHQLSAVEEVKLSGRLGLLLSTTARMTAPSFRYFAKGRHPVTVSYHTCHQLGYFRENNHLSHI